MPDLDVAPPTVDEPRVAPVGDSAILVEFGSAYSEAAHDAVLELDAAIVDAQIDGVGETVPAYVSLLVRFDPMVTDHSAVAGWTSSLHDAHRRTTTVAPERVVEVCYDISVAPELGAVADQVGLSREAVIGAHLDAGYRVVMYGFAPGSAYLAGVPESIQLPRKPAATSRLDEGSVIIAGPQCLIATTEMPTGWWVIGRSPTPIMRNDHERPFLFDPGDRVRFSRIDLATYEARCGLR